MLHILYIFAFTIIAFFAIGNLIRSLMTLSIDSQRHYSRANSSSPNSQNSRGMSKVTHPELLDPSGKPIDEPLLVMRSVSVEDARERLDAIYNASPSATLDKGEEGEFA
ncbi:DUF2973 domain-containing protein [Lusitaniella coriacea LEGE 07157]|uniref:DUF2973 domain-containing protein n=1 Tax=Lusitaniella coriacea LEGE 07157 TaxID=945747 RepID=A0A8J7DZ77_9CYAN|nr:DUF2973 domain-containing protein [Lusitaniella coriacea]MBE9118032.1 DUF2973 domain-containing protein [Lusitaniella coriacea LEGE 07157]